MRTATSLALALTALGLSGQSPAPAGAPAIPAAAAAPVAPPSTIAAPIVVDLAPMFAVAERTTPTTPPNGQQWINLPGMSKGSPAYRFNLYREPLFFILRGNRVTVHVMVNYWFEVGLRVGTWVKSMGSCGLPPEPYRKARLGMSAEVALRPDWELDLKLTPEEPLKIDGCAVTFLGYDITDKVLQGMKDNIAQATVALQQQIRDATKLRPRAEQAWLQAQQPIELSPGVFMLLNPERVRLSPFTTQGKLLTITPEIQIRPSVTLGAPPAVIPKPLPNLDLSGTPIAPGFKLQVDADLSYEHAAKQLGAQLMAKPFETEKGTFIVTGVAIRGKDGLAYLDLDLKGKIKGRLTLKGRPVFNEELGILRLEDLDYTLETKNLFASFGEWLYRGSLRKTLQEKCGFFLDKSLRELKDKTQQGLNRTLTPQVALTGTVDSFHVARVDVLPDRFKVVARLEGQVQLGVAGLGH